ncbi:MAG: hypothetical protein WCA49_00590 [Candidatus Sulfotelmatobacter sp.]
MRTYNVIDAANWSVGAAAPVGPQTVATCNSQRRVVASTAGRMTYVTINAE